VTLVDFDMLWGHRNDPGGFAEGLRAFDGFLPAIREMLGDDDILVITADHGCDPTTPGTDHSREYVPILVSGPGIEGDVDLGTRDSFSDLAATLAEGFVLDPLGGSSFFPDIWTPMREGGV